MGEVVEQPLATKISDQVIGFVSVEEAAILNCYPFMLHSASNQQNGNRTGAVMTFQYMVIRASKGVLNYAPADRKKNDVSAPEEQDLNSNDSGDPLDVSISPVELNPPMEPAATSICAQNDEVETPQNDEAETPQQFQPERMLQAKMVQCHLQHEMMRQ